MVIRQKQWDFFLFSLALLTLGGCFSTGSGSTSGALQGNASGFGGLLYNEPIYENQDVGILLLGTSGIDLDIKGDASLEVNGGVAIVDSSDPGSVTLDGQGRLSTQALYLAGGLETSIDAALNALQNYLTSALPDPLGVVPEPDPSQLPVQSATKKQISDNETLKPGVYQGGIEITGDAIVVLDPGIYYLQGGGLTVTGDAEVSGSGVLIFNASEVASDQISLGGGGSFSLSAPVEGTYQNLVLFQKRSSTAPLTISGDEELTLVGGIYAPGATLAINGDGNAVVGSFQVVDTLSISGDGVLSINRY